MYDLVIFLIVFMAIFLLYMHITQALKVVTKMDFCEIETPDPKSLGTICRSKTPFSFAAPFSNLGVLPSPQETADLYSYLAPSFLYKRHEEKPFGSEIKTTHERCFIWNKDLTSPMESVLSTPGLKSQTQTLKFKLPPNHILYLPAHWSCELGEVKDNIQKISYETYVNKLIEIPMRAIGVVKNFISSKQTNRQT